MAIELEYKLAVPDPALLEQILFDETIAQVRQENYRLLDMATVYYDTPERTLKEKHWTLRLRQENDACIATFKMPAPGGARYEYQCPASEIRMALPLLMEQGAPAELGELDVMELRPVCAARFTRRAADVRFADGTVCEFCGDVGALAGGSREQALCEVELELKSGNADTAAAFARELKERFSLQTERLSKFARAAALAEGETP